MLLKEKSNAGKEGFAFLLLDDTIKSQVKKDNNIIYGAQSIKRQIGPFARETKDYDIISKTPKQSADKLQRMLDKQSGGDNFYAKPAMHPGTFRVRHVGFDRKKGTDDDLDIADFTTPQRKYKTKMIDGIRYVTLQEVKKDKRKALRDPAYKFRHKKDKDDLDRIRNAKKFGIYWRG